MSKSMRLLPGLVVLAILTAVFIVPGAAADSHSKSVSGLDEQWLTTGLEGDLFEIKGGKLALQRSSNPAVAKLAKRLVKDHSDSFAEGAKLAKKLGIEVPSQPTFSQRWELKDIGARSGADFDAAYASLEVADHKQDIEEAKDEAEDGSNGEVRHDAKQEIPMLREHLALALAAVKATQ